MRAFWICLIILSCSSPCQAQFDNVWAFGNGSGLDFNNLPVQPVGTGIAGFGEACASICDEGGQLLFCTNGYRVWDRNGSLMPNGDALVSDPVLPPLSSTLEDYTSSTTQGALIVPVPGQPQRYYVFSMTCAETGISDFGVGRLYYSIVDMQLNGGMGDVLPVQKGILADSGLTEHMTAVAGDQCNIWLLAISRLSNTLRAYEINDAGLQPIPVVSPLLPVNNYIVLGSIAVSTDRRTLAVARSGIGLYDFDPATGVATGTVSLAGAFSPSTGGYSACFSPDNSKLYVAYAPLIVGLFYSFQYDLSSGDPLIMSNSAVPLTDPVCRSFRRGSDGKIYATGGGTSLHVIRYPNLAAPACQLQANAQPLTGTASMGLPNAVAVIDRDTLLQAFKVTAGCFASSVPLLAGDTAGWGYVWNTGDDSPWIAADTPGRYWLQYHTSPCVFRTDTFTVTFPLGILPELAIFPACGDSHNGKAYAYTYPGDTVDYEYTWRDGQHNIVSQSDTLAGVPSGSYTVRIRTASCDTILSLWLPEVNYEAAFEADTIICEGTLLSFTNTSDPSFTDFYWDFGNGNSSVATDPDNLYPLPGIYSVMLAAQGPVCRDTVRKRITVDSVVTGTFSVDRYQVCTGEPVLFNTSGYVGRTAMQWDFGDHTAFTTAPEALTRHAYDKEGKYAVVLTTTYRACPPALATDTIEVYPMPLVYLGADTGLCLNGAPVVLRNLAGEPGVPVSRLWSTGDTSAEIRVVHPGRYSLSLRAFPPGCSATEWITISKDCFIDIPNAFTPNGDGVNDYFFPRGLLSRKLTSFRMQVFNRWGQVVFETGNVPGRGWDGRMNGKDQPEGVYIYRIDAVIDGNRPEYYQGNVTLLR